MEATAADIMEQRKKNQSGKTKAFPEIFSDGVTSILESAVPYKDMHFDELEHFSKLPEILKDKRTFGLKKYGNNSFQSSVENLVLCPISKHLKEEIEDAINYSIALKYQSQITGSYPLSPTKIDALIKGLVDLWIVTDSMENK